MKVTVYFLIVLFTFSMLSFNIDTITEDKNLILKGDDVKSFQILKIDTFPGEPYVFDSEIEFTNLSTDEFLRQIDMLDSKMLIFLDDTLLFDPPIPIHHPISSIPLNDLCLLFDYGTGKFYLSEFYSLSNYDYLPAAEREQKIKELKDNSSMRKKQLDVFIKYLSEAGKIVGNTTFVEQIVTPESNAISVFPNPTSGELKVESGELKVKNIEIFDAMGKSVFNQQLSTFNSQLSINISHLPAGIYFLRADGQTVKFVKK